MTCDLKIAFDAHGPELRRYLRYRLDDAHMASDLVQDTFLRVIERPETRVDDVRAYLYTIARNLLLNHKKQEARRRTDSVPHEWLGDIAADAPTPEDAADARLQLERLQRFVSELPVRTQQIFVLNRVDGLTHVEVARALSISESSVQKHLAMAIQHVTQRLRTR
ncbi:RNA polymerase sigma factor [Ancylobacter sp. FA202]|uniref:RNA polymerase sigma factor n=1 Tax=Ancylobacter sp. FA202 TaxID=1111106 RepID=UPI0003719863|nr:RNA polymerase sigma factor [Ancylobacter sp. FA202]